MNCLRVSGSCVADELALDRQDLSALGQEHQVDDVGLLVAGREGRAVRLAGLIERAAPSDAARFLHVASADGSFTANIPIEEARRHGLILYELDGAALPAGFGGPFRLLFVDGTDCSVNVKQLGRVDFVGQAGSHTARCADDSLGRPGS